MNINIDAIISNSEYHKIEKGIYYGENIKNININGIIDNVPAPTLGKLNGKSNIVM